MRALTLSLILTLLLSGCAVTPLLIGGAFVGGVVVVNDRRTNGAILDDERIELETSALIHESKEQYEGSHINATSYNGLLLLTGEVNSEENSRDLMQRALKLRKVAVVQNELMVAPPSAAGSRTADTTTTLYVKSRLLTKLGVGVAHHVKVVTERGIVYLMGLVTRDEAAKVVEVVRTTSGVLRVVKVFEYIEEEQKNAHIAEQSEQSE